MVMSSGSSYRQLASRLIASKDVAAESNILCVRRVTAAAQASSSSSRQPSRRSLHVSRPRPTPRPLPLFNYAKEQQARIHSSSTVFAKSKKGKEAANEADPVDFEDNEESLEDDDLFGGSAVGEGSASEAKASKERPASRKPGRPAPDAMRPTFNAHIAEFQNRIKSENSSGTEREELRRVLTKELRRMLSGTDVPTPLSLAEIRALIDCMELVRFRTGLSLGLETSTKLLAEMAMSGYPEIALHTIFKRSRTGADYDLPSLQLIQGRMQVKLGSGRAALLESESLPGKPEIPERLSRSDQPPKKKAEEPQPEGEGKEDEGQGTAEAEASAKGKPEKNIVSLRQSLLGRMRMLAALGPSVNKGQDDVMLLSEILSAQVRYFGLEGATERGKLSPKEQSSAVLKHTIAQTDRLLRVITLAAQRNLEEAKTKKPSSAESQGPCVLPPKDYERYTSVCLRYYVFRLKTDPEAAGAIMNGGPEPVRTLSKYIEAVSPRKGARMTAQVEEWLRV